MNELEERGRNWTLRIFASVLLVSIHTIVAYNLAVDDVPVAKLTQQVIRFILTMVLLYQAFRGKRWAATILSVLFAIGVIIGLRALLGPIPFARKVPLLVMTLIYCIGLYHLNLSPGFKAYQQYRMALR